MEITGLDAAAKVKDVVVFHAGTARQEGRLITSGGRVLGVTALGDTLEQARAAALEAIGKIHFDGMQYRRDIGHRALKGK